MKKLLLIIIVSSVLSCKQTKNNDPIIEETNTTVEVEEVKKELNVSSMELWDIKGLKMTKTEELYQGEEVYSLSATANANKSSFLAINNIKIGYTGGKYKISIIAKSKTENSKLGIRIQEVYPTRFDAVFDFKDAKISGSYSEGELTANEKASIEQLGDGWYKCVLITEIYASYFRILFGPTTVGKNQVKVWEAENLNDKQRELFILPSSLKIVELVN